MTASSSMPCGYQVTGFGLTRNTVTEQDLPNEDEIKKCQEWICQFTKPSKSINPRAYSYSLKHKVEGWANEYVSNGAFIAAAAALKCKIEPIGNGPNAHFALDLLLPEDAWKRIRAMGFSKWLFIQQERNDPVGYLAKDAMHDETWPRRASKFIVFWMYLQDCYANQNFMDGLIQAWTEFSGNAPPAPTKAIHYRCDLFYGDQTDVIRLGERYQQAPSGMTYIYVLFEPETDTERKRVKYVGQTEKPTQRLKQHILQPGSEDKLLWIADLIRDRKYPYMGIIDLVLRKDAVHFEQTYIYAFDEYERGYGASLGDALLNKLLV